VKLERTKNVQLIVFVNDEVPSDLGRLEKELFTKCFGVEPDRINQFLKPNGPTQVFFLAAGLFDGRQAVVQRSVGRLDIQLVDIHNPAETTATNVSWDETLTKFVETFDEFAENFEVNRISLAVELAEVFDDYPSANSAIRKHTGQAFPADLDRDFGFQSSPLIHSDILNCDLNLLARWSVENIQVVSVQHPAASGPISFSFRLDQIDKSDILQSDFVRSIAVDFNTIPVEGLILNSDLVRK
jgi:hypothetical protein